MGTNNRKWRVFYEIVDNYEDVKEGSQITVDAPSKYAAKKRARALLDVPAGFYLNIEQVSPLISHQ